MSKRKDLLLVAHVAMASCLLFPLPSSAGTSAGGLSSENIEWVKNVPSAAGQTYGGRVHDGYLYMMVYGQGLLIYDVSQPEEPQLVGRYTLPYYGHNEDVATNGEILLMNSWSGSLGPRYVYVFDVSDKKQPKLIDQVGGTGPFAEPDREAPSHTYECLLDCKWAYGAWGQVLDLRKPADARLAGWWSNALPRETEVHDVTEVAPGLVLTASTPMYLLDARRNPLRPKVIATSKPSPNSAHNVSWPRDGRDHLIFSAAERRLSHRCTGEEDVAFETWDATRWRKTRTFISLDQYRVTDGTYVDGQPPIGGAEFGCSAHWAEEHPGFKNGGLVAAAFYGHGLRLLDVSSKGEISEAGYFLPWGGSVSAAYWITDDIVYTLDVNRGIDVLRVSAPASTD